MIGTIKYIANVQNSSTYIDDDGILQTTLSTESQYEKASFDEFVNWIEKQYYYQLDIETNVAERWNEFKLISIQFGSCEYGRDRVQYFFQWSALTDEQKAKIKQILENKRQVKLAHNGKFEYIVLKFHGIVIDNIYDTMLAEKVLRGGYESQDYALADISWKYLRISMDKTEQTNFGDDIITDAKIRYGITDVAYLDIIRKIQIEEASIPDPYGYAQLNTIALEMEALPGFSDITFEGLILDKEKWRENIRLAEPIVSDALKKLNSWLLEEPFNSYAKKKGYTSDIDRVTINFGSPHQRKELLALIFSDIVGATAPIVKKYVRDNATKLSIEEMLLLSSYMEKDYSAMSSKLIKEHRDYLVERGYLIPSGEITINWNSVQQVLPVIQLVEPKLKDLSEESVNKCKHPILKDLSAYKNALRLITTYGEAFIRKYVDSDGKVRTNFNQVLTTGRVSSSKPNMQNIVVTELVGTRYRNAFICDPNFVFVDSDFVSQELCIITYMSQDPVWLDAIANGYDLHSVCSELIFGKEWKDGADKDCAYYNLVVGPDGRMRPAKAKCSCKKHKSLRNKVKPINFG